MMHPLAICILLEMMSFVNALYDTSNYKILSDKAFRNVTYWDAQCHGELKFNVVLSCQST